MSKNGPTGNKANNPMLLWILVLGIGLGGAGVIYAVLQVLESLDENAAKMRSYKVKPKNPFEKSALPDFVEIVKRREAELDKHQEFQNVFKTGNSLLKRKDYEKALEAFQQALASYERDPDSTKDPDKDSYLIGSCHRGISDCYVASGNAAKALEHISMAYKLRNRRIDLVARSKIYDQLGQHELAAADRRASDSRLEQEQNIMKDINSDDH